MSFPAAWTEIKLQPYDYKLYNAKSREEREEAETEAAKRAETEREAERKDGEDMDEMALGWASNAAVYEWQDDYGDVGPAIPALEQELFMNRFLQRAGDRLSTLTEIQVTIESVAKIEPITKFDHAGLHPVMLSNVKMCGYAIPTPVQAYCLPAILQGHDIIAIAQTGSGKTAAYLIPVLSKLMGKAKKIAAKRPMASADFNPIVDGVRAEPLVLVICPTRELAVQIFDEARRLCYRSMMRPCVLYGGAPTRDQADQLRRGCDVLIATPGRLKDFIINRGNILSMARIRYTIIDEADEMVSPDWHEEMKVMLSGGDNNDDADHRFMMFSATFPKEARLLAREYMAGDHIRLRIGRTGSTHKNIIQRIIWADEQAKRQALHDLLMVTPPARTIVFVNGKKEADFLDDYLFNNGLPCTSIHSDRTQREREDALRAFKSGKIPILVATGVSSRGLDIISVVHVINYDLPRNEHGGIQEYIHRIGRTARIGNTGVATSFYNDRSDDLAPDLVKILLENDQTVPEFLQQFVPPEGEPLTFDDDSDKTDDESGAAGDGWGTGADDGRGAPAKTATTDEKPGDDSWGTPASPQAPTALDKGKGLASKAPASDDGWNFPAATNAPAGSSRPISAGKIQPPQPSTFSGPEDTNHKSSTTLPYRPKTATASLVHGKSPTAEASAREQNLSDSMHNVPTNRITSSRGSPGVSARGKSPAPAPAVEIQSVPEVDPEIEAMRW